MIRMNQRVYRYISETLVGSVGMFVWKLLKTARGTPQKMDKIRSIDHLWNGTVASAAVSLPGGHWSSPWLQYSGAARVSSEQFCCVHSCCGLVETQQFPDRLLTIISPLLTIINHHYPILNQCYVLMYLNCFWVLRVWDLSDLISVAVFRGVLKVFLGLSWPRLQRCVWGS